MTPIAAVDSLPATEPNAAAPGPCTTRTPAAFKSGSNFFRLCGEEVACTHRILRQRIDWVLADPGWATHASRVVQAGPSDHWPVLVELHRNGG